MSKTEITDLLAPYSKWLHWFVFVFAFLLYANTLNHQMALDDYSVIVTHNHVQKGIDGIGEILTTNYRHGNNGFNDGLYRPLSLITFALEKKLFNSDTFVAHLMNVLLYALACLFLYLSLVKIFDQKALIIPLGISLLFAAHPLHTEVVANIKGRDEILAFLGLSLSLYFMLKSISIKGSKYLLLSILFFIIALFSKESSVSYAVFIPLLVLLNQKVFFKQLTLPTILFLSFSIGFIGLRYTIVNSMSNPIDPGNFGILNNPIAAAADVNLKYGSTFSLQVTFLKKLFYPFQLIHDYSYNQIPLVKMTSPSSILGLLLLIGFIAAGLWGLVKRNVFGLIACLYLVSIVVASQIFLPIGIQFAERMLFIAVLPLALLVILLIDLAFRKQKVKHLPLKQQKVLAFVCIGITLIFSFKTFDRNKAWENNLSLYQADIIDGGNSARVNYNLGSELNERSANIRNQTLKNQYLNQSIQYLSKAISIYPEYQDAYNNLGLAYKNIGQYEQAAQTFLKGIQLDENYTKNYYNLSTVYFSDKKFRKSILAMQEYVNRNPNNANAYYYMGQAAGNIQQFEEAIGYLNQAVSIQPNHVDALNFLGMAYGMTGKNPSAEQSFQRAVQLAPNRTDILMNLALCYHNQGKIQQETDLLKKILSLDPNHQMARNQLQQIGG